MSPHFLLSSFCTFQVCSSLSIKARSHSCRYSSPLYLRQQAETLLSQFSTECHVLFFLFLSSRGCLSSLLLSVLTHTRACHFGSWIFHEGEFAWSQSCVTSSPGRLSAAERSNFPVTPLRQNRNETSMLIGIVCAKAILFQGVSQMHGACEDKLKQESLNICPCTAVLLYLLNHLLL